MSEKVIVVLDRGTADYLRLLGNDHHSPEFFSDCYQGDVMPAVEAALGRDREELVERVARNIWEADSENDTWDEVLREYPPDLIAPLVQAEAALAAIEEADQ